MRKAKVGILISGRGSNMSALIDAAQAEDYPAHIALVISNVADAPGLAKAEAAGIATRVIKHQSYQDRETFDDAISAALRDAGVEVVCLAGFMRILTKEFVQRWKDRVINIHPSLLPAFKGTNVHHRVLDAGVKISGCTVHYIRAEMDEGPVIAQAAVPVLPGDDADSLAERVLMAEHRLYPLALSLVASGNARVASERVSLTNTNGAESEMFNPVSVNF